MIKKKLKKLRKKAHYLIPILIICVFLLSDQHTINVKADSNYSNYLTSESISVKQDRALILLEQSSSGNNYRNYYETGFLFPSKLRDEMYSTQLTTNPAKYYVQQAYLSDLDSDYAFSDAESLGLYETTDYIENYTDFTYNNGNYESTYISNTTIIYPQQDIDVNWNENNPTSNNHSENLKYSSWCIYCYESDGLAVNDTIQMSNNNTIQYTLITEIEVYANIFIHKDSLNNPSDDILCTLNKSDGTSLGIKDFNVIVDNWQWYKVEYSVNLLPSEIQDLYCTFTSCSFLDSSSYCQISQAYISITGNYIEIDVLEKTDNSYYNFITNESGGGGLYPAEYTFTDDSGDPDDFTVFEGGSSTIDIIDTIDGHDKIVEFYDYSASVQWYMYQAISGQTSGSIEFWIRMDSTSDRLNFLLKDVGSGSLYFVIRDNGYFSYYDGSYNDIETYSANTWYHIEFQFDTTDWHLWINQVQKDSSGYGFNGSPTNFDQVYLESSVSGSANCYHYLDALDYSWSSGYERNRNMYDASFSLNFTSNLEIERSGNSWDNIEGLELEYTVKANDTCDFELYLENTDTKLYDSVDTQSITTSFQEFSYSYDLNYTYYSALGITNFMFFFENDVNTTISIDKISLKATFSNFSLNENGYHNVGIKFNRKTSGDTYRGNITFDLQLYKTNFTYDYIEDNNAESDYSRLNQFVDFSSLGEEIIECEIQAHIRYGLNTLDIEIVNVYYKVMINYNFTFELYEQLRLGNNDGNYFRSEFSYDAMNFNRLNNTGIYGNYSSNCLSGLRVLRGDTSQNYNRYFTIPYFDEKITLSYAPSGVSGSSSGSEPPLPVGTYWEYTTFRIAQHTIYPITVENWTVDFTQMKSEQYTAKHPYYKKVVKRSDLGDWKFKLPGDFRVSFNFIRNAFADSLNMFLLFLQYIWFLLMWALSYISMYLGTNMLVVIWNVLLYYLFVALIWILWYVYVGLFWVLYYIWQGLIWVWENWLLPFFEWFLYEFMPLAIDVFIMVWAFLITLLIYCMTLGQIDFWETYDMVYKMLWEIADFVWESTVTIMNDLDALFIAISLYLMLIGMTYFTYLICKSRGFTDRAESLYNALMVYLLPITLTYQIIRKIYDSLPDSIA